MKTRIRRLDNLVRTLQEQDPEGLKIREVEVLGDRGGGEELLQIIFVDWLGKRREKMTRAAYRARFGREPRPICVDWTPNENKPTTS
jgi:hypothetical protein